MRKIMMTFMFCGIGCCSAQTVVFNDRLMAQLTKNQLARTTSEKSFFNSYAKQKELYDDAKKKIAKVLAIQEYIYHQLYNVNSFFEQSAKVKYIYQDLLIIAENTSKILQLSFKYPQYIVFLTQEYTEIISRSLTLKKFLQENVLKKGEKILMDAYERDELLEEIRVQVYSLRGYTYYILSYLENAKKTPYLLHIKEIQGYVDLDKMIINDIIRKYENF